MANGKASWADEKRTLASKNDVFVGTRTTAGSQQWRARITRLQIVLQPEAGQYRGRRWFVPGVTAALTCAAFTESSGFEAKWKGYTDIGGRCRQVTSGINHLLSL